MRDNIANIAVNRPQYSYGSQLESHCGSN